jgi:Calx-beta domain/Carboxypeptidase regulatory-like domain/Domain of unknown function (DUF4214)
VRRTGGSFGAVSVDYAVSDGTATIIGNDYSISPTTGTLTWADGDATDRTISITIKGDSTNELDESINLTLSNPTGGSALGGTNPLTLTILNEDGPTAANGLLTGQIVTADGEPVSGATVTVIGGSRLIRAITDSNGMYRVADLETGEFYSVSPSRSNYNFAPANRSFSIIAEQTEASFTGIGVEDSENPLDTPEFFVRQQYLDFLDREPEQGGLDYWSAQLRSCNADLDCLRARRIGVSAAFFVEREFQNSGLFIFDLYQAGLGRRPAYTEYVVDKTQISTGPSLETDKSAFVEGFVERAEFSQRYPLTMTATAFVDALLQTAEQSSGLDLSAQRANLIELYENAGNSVQGRKLVLRSLAESNTFKQAQYNSGFVLMQYFGYLRRDPDQGGYEFWLDILNNHEPDNYRGMVCAFLTSSEYQLRFATLVTRSNRECGQ